MDPNSKLQAALAKGDFQTAARLLKAVVTKNPQDAGSHYTLGVVLRKLHDPVQALRHLRRASQIAPNLADPHLSMGNIHSTNGEDEEAISAFERARALDPSRFEASNNLGQVYFRRGDYEEALRHYERACAIAPNDLLVLSNRCFALDMCGRRNAAIEGYRKILSIKPTHTEALLQLSILLARNASPDQSPQHVLMHVEKALTVEPRSIRIWGHYATIAKAFGLEDVWQKALRRIAELPPAIKDDLSTKMWAFLQSNQPREAFAIQQKELNIIPFDELSRVREGEGKAQPLTMGDGAPPAQVNRPIILVAASNDYAELYADSLVESALKYLPACDVHMHLMNLSSYEPRVALKKFPKERVTWSSENIQPDAPKSVYAARRFVYLPELLRQTQRMVICVDIDSIFNADIGSGIAGLSPFDVLIYERPSEIYVQQMVAAGFFAVSPTVPGMEFADFVASYIHHFENAGASRWFVDQLAIVAAKAWHAANNEPVVIKAAPTAFLDWSMEPDASCFIWTAKGNRKRALAAKQT